MKKFKSLFIILCILLSTIFATGAVNSEEVTALLKTITIKSQNATETTEALFYKGHIYTPLSSTAKTLNTHAKWYGSKQTLELDSKNFVDFPEANPLIGERFVYGEIVDMDKYNYTILIEQHIDDNSIYLEPEISVAKDAVLILQRNHKKMNIDFEDLYFGEYVGIVLNPKGQARGIILNS